MKTCQSYSMMFFGRWIALFARFGSVKTLDDWHVEMYLLIWRSLGFAQLDLIWKKKESETHYAVEF